MKYRDAHGQFRRPTDEERWPDPIQRAAIQQTRSHFAEAHCRMDGAAGKGTPRSRRLRW
mgnify:CR=1 FL=1